MKKAVVVSSLIALVLCACTKKPAELGTAANPVKFHFVPSVDAKVIEDSSKKLKEYLEAATPYKYEIVIPQSYIAVVEAFGAKKADVAAINTFGYVTAFEKYAVEARLTVLRNGSSTYQSEFIAKAGGPIKKIEDLAGKKVAFVEANSTSGYLLPLKILKDKKIEPKETIFAGKHDNVVTMVYQGQVDAGATFYSPPAKNEKGVEKIEDARRLVLAQFPDVEKKVSIISLSAPITNDPIVFRKELNEEMKSKITDAIVAFIQTPDGQEVFKDIYGVTGIKKATDADYESVRSLLKSLGQNAADLLQK